MYYFDTKAYQLKLPDIFHYMPIISILCGVLALVCLILLIVSSVIYRRNHKVYSFRLSLLDVIYKKSKIDKFENCEWRIKEYEKVSYGKMLYMFWRHLKPENFYKNLDFLA